MKELSDQRFFRLLSECSQKKFVVNDLTTAQLKKLMATASTDQISYFSKKKNTHYPAKIILVNKNGNLVPEIQWLNSK